MSQLKVGDIITLPAADVSIAAYHIATVDANGRADFPATTTTNVIGVTNNNASATGEAVGIILSGTAKVKLGATVTAGDIVGAITGGKGTGVVGTTTAAIIGIALESGVTNSVIEVTIQPRAL
jgi:hypothetical protein